MAIDNRASNDLHAEIVYSDRVGNNDRLSVLSSYIEMEPIVNVGCSL